MNLNEFNSLTDLFFYQSKKQNPHGIFLEWLNPVNRKKFTWSETIESIYKFAKIINQNIIVAANKEPVMFKEIIKIYISLT